MTDFFISYEDTKKLLIALNTAPYGQVRHLMEILYGLKAIDDSGTVEEAINAENAKMAEAAKAANEDSEDKKAA